MAGKIVLNFITPLTNISLYSGLTSITNFNPSGLSGNNITQVLGHISPFLYFGNSGDTSPRIITISNIEYVILCLMFRGDGGSTFPNTTVYYIAFSSQPLSNIRVRYREIGQPNNDELLARSKWKAIRETGRQASWKSQSRPDSFPTVTFAPVSGSVLVPDPAIPPPPAMTPPEMTPVTTPPTEEPVEVGGIAGRILSALTTPLTSVIESVVAAVRAAVQATVTNITVSLPQGLSDLGTNITEAINGITTVANNWRTDITSTVTSTVQAAVTAGLSGVSGTITNIGAAVQTALTGVNSAVTGIRELLSGLTTSLGTSLGNIVSSVQEPLIAGINTLRTWLSTTITAMQTAMTNVITQLRTTLETVTTGVSGFVTQIATGIKEGIAGVITGVSTGVANVVTDLGGLDDAIKGFLDGIGARVLAWLEEAFAPDESISSQLPSEMRNFPFGDYEPGTRFIPTKD